MLIKLEIKCPFCDWSRTQTEDVKESPTFMRITCDPDDGGCDRDFAVSFRAKPEIDYMELKKINYLRKPKSEKKQKK